MLNLKDSRSHACDGKNWCGPCAEIEFGKQFLAEEAWGLPIEE